jgi:hypothetical protein
MSATNIKPRYNKDECVIYCKVEYITSDGEANHIVIGISKKTKADILLKMLRDYEGKEVNLIIRPFIE